MNDIPSKALLNGTGRFDLLYTQGENTTVYYFSQFLSRCSSIKLDISEC